MPFLFRQQNYMSIELVMPKAGLTNTEGTIAQWKFAEGEFVKKGEAVLEIETEKVTMDVDATADGFLHIIEQIGTVVTVGGKIAILATTKEEYAQIISQSEEKTTVPVVTEEKSTAPQPTFAPTATSTTDYIRATPLAKKVAKAHGVDLHLVTPTGPSGRVVERDVRKFMEEKPAPQTTQAEAPTLIPFTANRRAIAKNMYHSLQTMAQTSDSVEIDVTELVAMRKQMASMAERVGTKISMNDLLSFATLRAIKMHPLANATMVDEGILTYPYIHLSMAVATDYGLTSPVIEFADKMSLLELSTALRDVITRAREGNLRGGELSGGTFTITNMSNFPVDTFNPIVNPPQSAIVGFGRLAEKPAVYNGEICIRTMMWLNITYDHRVFDGAEVGSILRDLKDILENPTLMFLS